MDSPQNKPETAEELARLQERVRQLELERDFFQQMVERSSDPFYLIDPAANFRFTYVNDAVCRHYGRSRDDLLQMSIPDWDPLFTPERCATFWDELQSRRSMIIETVHRHADGHEIPVEVTANALAIGDRHLLGGWFQDISERKAAERALRESEERLRDQYAELEQIYRYAPIGLFTFDRDYRFMRINERMAEINGFPVEYHPGKSIDEIVPDLADFLKEAYRPIFERGEPVLEVEIHGATPAAPDTPRDWIGNYFPLYSGEGEIIGLIGAVLEVTERKKAQRALREKEERFRLALQAANDAVWDWNLATDQVAWNQAVADAFGHTEAPSGTTGSWWMEQIHPEDRDRVVREVEEVIAHGTTWQGEYRFRRADGSYAYVLDRGSVLRGAEGQAERMVGAMLDLSEKQEAQQALRTIFNSTYDAAVIHTPQGRIVDVNKSFLELHRTSYQQALKLTIAELCDPSMPMAEAGAIWADVMAGSPRLFEWKARRGGDGTPFDAEIYLRKVRLRGEDLILANVRDISARKLMEDNLRTAKRAAEGASRSKSEFLANMSHEIRTPLNGVFGMLQLLKTTPLAADQTEYIDIALQSGQKLLTILNDILDLSRIEAGRMTLASEAFMPAFTARSVVDILLREAENKGILLAFDLDPSLSTAVRGDEGRLRQILFNLVGNAIKFTTTGEVRIAGSAEPVAGDAAKIRLHFSVSDTGIGIPREKLADVFEAFTQADGTYSRRFGGSGLGLSIVKRLVNLMGGEVAIESEPGRGTRVSFHIQAEVAPEIPASKNVSGEPEKISGRVFRILVAEDEPINRLAIRRLLEKQGHRVVTVTDGQAALDALAAEDFDLIFMDVQMPRMDGIAATRSIRRLSDKDKARIPIVALTAHAMKGDREKFLAAGMDEYLSKPLDFAQVSRMVERLVDGAAPRSAD